MANQETLNLFDTLYYETYSDVLKYVIMNCTNIEYVKDIVQNVYVDVLTKLEKNKSLLSKSYIIGIAKNKVKDYYRYSYKNKVISLFSNIKSQDELDLIDTIDADIDIEMIILKEDDINFIWEYLKKQSVIIARVFYLYYYMDYSIKDISKELNISESNVKNYLYRTLEKLDTLLKDRVE